MFQIHGDDDTSMTPPCQFFPTCFHGLLLPCLTSFTSYILSGIADSLTLVRFWGATGANASSHIANQLLVNTADNDVGVTFNRKLNSWGGSKTTGWLYPKLKVQIAALYLGPIANSLNFQDDVGSRWKRLRPCWRLESGRDHGAPGLTENRPCG
jgi:hypothetical protein